MLADEEAAAARRRRTEAYLDQHHGSAWLRDQRVASVVQDALLFFDGDRYRLHAWVVMPTHVHTLMTPIGECALGQVVSSWRSFTAKRANAILGRSGAFWYPDYFDRYIRDERHYEAAVAYIENNPVKAGLCSLPGEWPWSSAGCWKEGKT